MAKGLMAGGRGRPPRERSKRNGSKGMVLKEGRPYGERPYP